MNKALKHWKRIREKEIEEKSYTYEELKEMGFWKAVKINNSDFDVWTSLHEGKALIAGFIFCIGAIIVIGIILSTIFGIGYEIAQKLHG